MTTAARFTQADVKRAFRGAVSAGVPVASVKIRPNGEIEILLQTGNRVHDNDEWADLE